MNKKVALITGGSKRIGREISLHLSKKYKLLIHYNNSFNEAKDLSENLKDLGLDCKTIKYDFNDTTKIRNFSQRCIKKYGSIELLINNASIFEEDEIDERLLVKNMNINLISPMLLTKYLGEHMKKNCGGNIINIGDSLSLNNPWHKFTGYTISKSGLNILTKTMPKNFNNKVRVNSLNLGPIMKPSDKKINNIYKTNYRSKDGISSILKFIDYILKDKKINGKIFNIDNAERLMINSY